MKEFKMSQKVMPVAKSIYGDSLEKSNAWKAAKKLGQNYLYINGYDNDLEAYVCGESVRTGGDYFKEEELIPYENLEKPEVFVLQYKSEVLGIFKDDTEAQLYLARYVLMNENVKIEKREVK